MSRRLVNITLDNLSDLPVGCRRCVYWELDPVAAERARASGDTALEKEAWVSDTLLEWGSCGQLAYVDGVPAGYTLYAPAAYVPRALAFATSPVSPDAILLMTGRIVPEFAGSGLGRMLVQTVARETYGTASVLSKLSDARPWIEPATSEVPARTRVCSRPTTCEQSVSRPCARIRGRRGCGWTSGRRRRGVPTWSMRSSDCSARSSHQCCRGNG